MSALRKAGRPSPHWIENLASMEFVDGWVDTHQLEKMLKISRKTIQALFRKHGLQGDYYQSESKCMRIRYDTKALKKFAFERLEHEKV